MPIAPPIVRKKLMLLVTIGLDRPLLAKLADDFCALPKGISGHPGIKRFVNPHPRPLEAKTQLLALLDAFYESVTRRVTSIDNAEKWRVEHPDDVARVRREFSALHDRLRCDGAERAAHEVAELVTARVAVP